jgi:hypothetical protein
VAVFFPCVAAVLSFSFPFRAQSPTADILPGQSYLQETMDEKVDCGDSGPRGPERRYRFSYGYGPGVDVYGWPSKGGIYTLHNCLGVELEFLGFDRFDLPRDLVEPQSEEDEHCDRSESALSYLYSLLPCRTPNSYPYSV